MNRRTARLKRKSYKYDFLKKLHWKRIFKFVVRLGFIAAIVFIITSIPNLIKITAVECQSQFGPCSNSLAGKLNGIAGKSYFSAKSGIKHILEKDFFVAYYTVKLKLPSTFEVYAVERKAEVAFVKQNNTSEFILVDGDGMIINIQNKTSLPVIILKHDYNFVVGQPLPSDLLFAETLMKQTFRHYDSRLGYVDSFQFQTELPDGVSVIFPLQGDIDELFGSLTLILSRLNTEAQESRIEDVLGKFPKTIDLRFNNPVLR